MKDQTSLIVIVVAGIFTVGAGIGLFLTKREPVSLTAPTAVNLTAPSLPAGDVAYSNGISSGSGAGGGAGRGAFGGVGGAFGAPGGGGPKGRPGRGGKGTAGGDSSD